MNQNNSVIIIVRDIHTYTHTHTRVPFLYLLITNIKNHFYSYLFETLNHKNR